MVGVIQRVLDLTQTNDMGRFVEVATDRLCNNNGRARRRCGCVDGRTAPHTEKRARQSLIVASARGRVAIDNRVHLKIQKCLELKVTPVNFLSPRLCIGNCSGAKEAASWRPLSTKAGSVPHHARKNRPSGRLIQVLDVRLLH